MISNWFYGLVILAAVIGSLWPAYVMSKQVKQWYVFLIIPVLLSVGGIYFLFSIYQPPHSDGFHKIIRTMGQLTLITIFVIMIDVLFKGLKAYKSHDGENWLEKQPSIFFKNEPKATNSSVLSMASAYQYVAVLIFAAILGGFFTDESIKANTERTNSSLVGVFNYHPEFAVYNAIKRKSLTNSGNMVFYNDNTMTGSVNCDDPFNSIKTSFKNWPETSADPIGSVFFYTACDVLVKNKRSLVELKEAIQKSL